MNKEQINKLLNDLYGLILEKPEYYTEVITCASKAWNKYKANFNEKEAGLDLLFHRLIDKKTAKEFIKNRNTEGYLNLDMFPKIEDTLKKIATN